MRPTWSTLAPGLGQFRTYDRRSLRGDLQAGVTVAAYLVPQVMAYATVAGLPPVTGLWAALGPLAVYTLLGSSRQLSVGPESSTALMTAVTLGPLASGDPRRYATLAAVLAVLVGVFGLLGRLARLGFFAELLSKPVLTGYLAGIAVLMIAGELGAVTGAPVTGSDVLQQVNGFLRAVRHVHWPTLAIAGAVLVLLLVLARVAPQAPGPLLAVLAATAAVAAFSLQQHGVQVVGQVPRGLPVPGLAFVSGSDLAALVLPAASILLVGYSDITLTSRAFASRRGETVDANQELTALGAINVAAGLLHGFPVSCSASRTVLGDAVGSRTQLYSVVSLAGLVLVLLVGGPVLAVFPAAALGALVVYAAFRLIDLPEFRRIARFRRSEFVLAVLTTAAVVGFGVLYGVLAAIALSVLDLLRKLARPHDGILAYVPGVAGMHDVDDYPEAQPIPGLIVYRYDAPLCFANAENFRARALGSLGDSTEWFLLNAEANVEIDFSGADALDQLRAELDRRGIVFAMARVKQDVHDQLSAAGLVDRIGANRIFMTLPSAVAAYAQWYEARHGKSPGDASRG